MLTEKMSKVYNQEVENLLTHNEIKLEARADNSKNRNQGRATLVSVSGKIFINNPKLSEEVFGPYSLIVRCQNKTEIDQVLNSLDGQLTGSIFGDSSELSLSLIHI